jgi:AcrR family transcriptional regulator
MSRQLGGPFFAQGRSWPIACFDKGMGTQRPRGTTTRQAVVNAALAIAEQAGLERLTIRAVADRVGAPPMSLYTHFRNKNGLLDLMLAEVAARMYLCEWHPTWQAELIAMCRRVYHLFTDHPTWIQLLSRPTWLAEMPVREHLLELLADDGIEAADGLLLLSSAVLTVLGLVLVERSLTGPDGECVIERRFEHLKKWIEMPSGPRAAGTPALVSGVMRSEFERVFELSVGALVTGFEAKSAVA